jgi:hypothetical protein
MRIFLLLILFMAKKKRSLFSKSFFNSANPGRSPQQFFVYDNSHAIQPFSESLKRQTRNAFQNLRQTQRSGRRRRDMGPSVDSRAAGTASDQDHEAIRRDVPKYRDYYEAGEIKLVRSRPLFNLPALSEEVDFQSCCEAALDITVRSKRSAAALAEVPDSDDAFLAIMKDLGTIDDTLDMADVSIHPPTISPTMLPPVSLEKDWLPGFHAAISALEGLSHSGSKPMSFRNVRRRLE